MDKTILYLTENRLDEEIAELCRRKLKEAAGDIPIISVSQKPIELGKNICVGYIGRSWMNLYRQQLAGLEEVNTDFVAIAEHDVLYTSEHFKWIPPDNNTFYYNDNCWFVEWKGNHPELEGMYSRWSKDRFALSQLICSTELLKQSILERIELINAGIRQMRKLGEPGSFDRSMVELAHIAISDKSYYIRDLFKQHLIKFQSKSFKTINPNLDIRHNSNFTGPRRGIGRCYELSPWGKFKDIIK